MKSRPRIEAVRGLQPAYYFRRLLHLSLLLVPFAYEHYAALLAAALPLTMSQFWLLLLCLVALLEVLRLKWGVLLWGQRDYERHQVCSLAWTLVALILVLWLAPSPAYRFTLIASCALGDPLLGELRRFISSPWLTAIIGGVFLVILWVISAFYWDFSWALAILLAVLCTWVESWSLRWIDDNALMLLAPLLVILAAA